MDHDFSLKQEKFSTLLYPGLDSFRDEDVHGFLNDPSQFSLTLNKVKGKGILYGVDHVALRASYLNELDRLERISIVSKKLQFAEIFSTAECSRLTDVQDIGMGHSVYKLTFGSDIWVLKPREAQNQLFYCDVLRSLGWSSFEVKAIETSAGKWELSEYLGSDVLGSLFQPGSCLSRSVENELARQAALGDVLGRGDRHFENYVVKNGQLFPIDLSYLFWEDNETWVQRYISGGMAEFSSLGFFAEDPVVFCDKVTSFFLTYEATLKEISTKKSVLHHCVNTHYSEEQALQFEAFIETRLSMISDYYEAQKQRYIEGLDLYLKRKQYKLFLINYVVKHPELLTQYPRLKMYYLADKDRLSAFFLEEVFGDGTLFSVLDDLRIKSNNL